VNKQVLPLAYNFPTVINYKIFRNYLLTTCSPPIRIICCWNSSSSSKFWPCYHDCSLC